ncbi:hypothetical protein ETAA8_12900 [Anatilimnocola aggregata]|uniref:Hemerythrin-like domain-containing protein n=1 Tax=Anatilimnocola aggregata TaxID=2528021 RepID=A0A517Y7P7_9BACT|nr:hypothetical protein [Anatilimnocola aggregata]QDU26215.1 hypothetical protein ETAA8_12900 [Anatilimnocola aggregata]
MSDHEECRTYLNHVQLQHQHMQQLLERLRSLVVGAKGCSFAFDDAKLLLSDLGDHLARHIAEEEGGGCIDEAVCRCPRLSLQARDLKAQQPRLVAAIERIVAKFEGRNRLGTCSFMVEQEIQQLASDLRLYEESERELLAEAFGVDEGCSTHMDTVPHYPK